MTLQSEGLKAGMGQLPRLAPWVKELIVFWGRIREDPDVSFDGRSNGSWKLQ